MTDQQAGEDRPGLPASDQPGRRSGAGAGSVVDQMRKDQERNSNDRIPDADLPTPARDATSEIHRPAGPGRMAREAYAR